MLFSFILSFIAGFVDTATFVGARGVLSAHVTGNFVLFTVALLRGVEDIDYLKLLLFIPFFLALIIVAKMRSMSFLSKRFESFMLLAASIALIIPGLYFLGVTKLENNYWDISYIFIMFPVVAMGIQNALYKILSPTDPMTTVMTGNVTQMALELIGFKGEDGKIVKQKTKLYSIVRVIVGFAVGCVAGAWSVGHYSLGALLVPALLFLALSLHRFKNDK